MRAVRSTINAAGLLKRENPEQDETQIVLKAVMDINLPKFLKNDIPLFKNILSDLFPGVELAKPNLGLLEQSVHNTIKELNLDPVDQFVTKIWQLFDTMNVRHGLMLVGPTGSGKTVSYQVLKDAINKVALDVNIASDVDLEENPWRKVQCRILNPKSILNEQIYGQLNQMTKE
jgi:dynein heavy chain